MNFPRSLGATVAGATVGFLATCEGGGTTTLANLLRPFSALDLLEVFDEQLPHQMAPLCRGKTGVNTLPALQSAINLPPAVLARARRRGRFRPEGPCENRFQRPHRTRERRSGRRR